MRPTTNSLNLLAALMTLCHQQPDAAGGGINSTAVRPDVAMEWPEGDLPEQMLGAMETVMPGDYTFRLPTPDKMAQCWHDVEVNDTKPGSKTLNQKVVRRQLKFDANTPLVIVGGEYDGLPYKANWSTNPRARGKKDDPKTPWVSDIAYLLAVSLNDKRRPTSQQELEQIINGYGGREIRLRSGLSGQCRPDHAVRLEYTDPTDLTFAAEGRAQRTMVIADPSGRKGCAKRYYTDAFKNPNPTSAKDRYFTEVQCSGTYADATGTSQPCDAIVRGWPQADGFLPPLAGQ